MAYPHRLFLEKQESTETLIRSLLNRFEPDYRDRFLALMAQIQDQRTLDQLADLIAQGRIEEALASALQAANPLASLDSTIFMTSGNEAAAFVQSVQEVVIDFNQVNSRAVRIMEDNQLRLVREFTQQQRQATREALLEGIRTGENPRAQARAFRRSIGLTLRQMQSVNNFKRLLREDPREAMTRALRDRRFDRSILRAIDTEQPLSEAQVDRMVDRYHERFLRHRAETIARTETLWAVHAGTEELFQQAMEQGALTPGDLTRKWITRLDGRERASHHTMNGQEQPFGTPFVSGDGNLLRYPGDENAPASERIQCRCVLATRMK